MRALVALLLLALGASEAHSLVDWSTSEWLRIVDFTLRAILSPQGIYGINKFIDIATNGTGSINLNVSSFNFSWHIEKYNLTLETVRLGGLDTVSGLAVLEPSGRYGLASGLNVSNASLAANVSINGEGWMELKAQTEALNLAITAIVEAYQDELAAMHENQVLHSRCWNRTLEAFDISRLDVSLRIYSLVFAASSRPLDVRIINQFLKELVKNDAFQKAVQSVLEAEANKIRIKLNEKMEAVLSNSSATPCPEPIDMASVDEKLPSAFSYLPLVALGLLLIYAGIALGVSRKKTYLSMGVMCHRKDWQWSLLNHALLAVALATQLYSLQVAISSVILDARVCEGSSCVPYPVLMTPVCHFSFSVLIRDLWDADAGLLVFAMFVCFCSLPLGIQTLLFASWWVPVSPKWQCTRRYVIVLMSQTCKLCLSTVIFQVYMISVLGSNSRLVLDEEGSYLQIKIQGKPEFAVYCAIFSNLLTWALCHVARRAHDSIWPRDEVDSTSSCCKRRRASSRSPVPLIAGMLVGTVVAAVVYGLAFVPNMVSFTTYGLLGLVESGDKPGGFTTQVDLLSLGSRITNLIPDEDSTAVLFISAVYYLTMMAAPILALTLLFAIWGSALKQFMGSSKNRGLTAMGADTEEESASWLAGRRVWLESLFLCLSLVTLDGLVAVSAAATAEMHLLFTRVVVGRLPFLCGLWTNVSNMACVGLVGTFEAGGYWVAAAWAAITTLGVATEYCFVFSGSLGLGSKSAYQPIR